LLLLLVEHSQSDGLAARLGDWEPRIHAFAHLCEPLPETPLRIGQALDGHAIGIKDVIDVAGMPTRNGSASCADAAPAKKDAPVVARLRAAGASIIGKTTTTEFAFTDPTLCRNPHDTARSPGGSSSGSGAAVAAGILDIALGTQTAGSLCRPAAYCGAVGFKPTYGALSTAGVTPLAPSFDTVGIIARSVPLAAEAFRVMSPPASIALPKPKKRSEWHAARLLLDQGITPASDTRDALEQANSALGDICGRLSTPPTQADAIRIVADHRIVMHHEAACNHGHLLEGADADLLKPKFRAGLEAGLTIAAGRAQAARDRLEAARADFWAGLAGIDIVLTLPVPQGAPLIDGTTGFQDWLTPWTVFHGPLISLPWGKDGQGRPRAVMLAAHPQEDQMLLAAATALAKHAPPMPPPVVPRD
jgi:Asp-tRNA(Asn)/Glu-tRNA(Gln) amidotransferase A subunit family amidase